MDKSFMIPSALRHDVKVAITEAGMCGPLGVVSGAADVAAIAGCWGILLVKYARYFKVTICKKSAVDICTTLLLGMGGYYAGCRMATRAMQFIPGAGWLIGAGVSSVANVVFTYRYALALACVFAGGENRLASLAASITTVMAGMGSVMSLKEIVSLYRTV